MFVTKITTAIAVVLMLGFVATGATFQTYRTAAGQDDLKPTAEKPVHPKAKQEKQKETFTAWGKEVNGVQVGIQLGEHRAYQVGENVTLILRVRNNGKVAVPFRENVEHFLKNPPLMTDADGKAVTIKARPVWGIISQNSVAPGKEVDLVKLTLALRPATDREKAAAWTLYGTGKFQIQYPVEDVVGEVRVGSPGMALITGKLELEVKEAPPEKQKVLTPEEAIKVAGDSKLAREFNESKSAVEFKLQFVTKAIPVKVSSEKDAAWVHGHSPDDVCLGLLVPSSPVVADDLLNRNYTRFVATLTGKVIGQLNKAGINDMEKHFKGKTIRVAGTISRREYDGLGTPSEVEIVVDELSQLEVVD